MRSPENASAAPISHFPPTDAPPSSPGLRPALQVVTLDALKDLLVQITQEVRKLPVTVDGVAAVLTDTPQDVKVK
jgi:hypothetical protein